MWAGATVGIYNHRLFFSASQMPVLAASFKKLFIFTKVYNSIFIVSRLRFGRIFFPMPVSYYHSTLTTALNDNENRNILFKRRWLLSMSFTIRVLPCLQGAGLVFKTILTGSSEPSSHPCSIESAFHSSAENKLNTRLFSVGVFQMSLKTQRLSLTLGMLGPSCLAVLALGSRTWPAPRCHTCLWRQTFLWAFFPSVPAVSLLLYNDLLLSPLGFPCIKKKKKNRVTKQFSLRVKMLQIQACYLYSILMNNSPTLMPCVWLTYNYELYFL